MTGHDPIRKEDEHLPPAAPPPEEGKKPIPRVSSAAIFGASDRVVIEHRDQEYVLLITRNGKLLLNRWRS